MADSSRVFVNTGSIDKKPENNILATRGANPMKQALDDDVPALGADESLIQLTLQAATRDKQLVTEAGITIRRLTEGVSIRQIPTQVDDRGSVFELYDLRWHFHPDPLVFAYCFTLRPGRVKGWALHKDHEDRYVLLKGELKLVLFDPRPASSTYGEVCEIWLTECDRKLVSIPRFVWHADQNVGLTDVIAVNFPTIPYDHVNPDKYRLPLYTDLIPYRFPADSGW
jgi:dTDP-4-dehydrorhamnose 3,5-epimerase